MKPRFLQCSLLLVSLGLAGCVSSVTGVADGSPPAIGEPQVLGLIENDALNEASGLVDSRQQPGVLWAHNDSGDVPRLFAIGRQGNDLGTVTLTGVTARDWEDLALGPGPVDGTDYLYIGDFGDNQRLEDVHTIYRIAEPDVPGAGESTETAAVDLIYYRLPDERRDMEAFFVDPQTADIYFIAKGGSVSPVYRLPAPISVGDTLVAEALPAVELGRIVGFPAALQGATAADVSLDGGEALVKTYRAVYYWRRADTGLPWFGGPATQLPYEAEPQGEAITWAADGSGYFVVSEERGAEAQLTFYPRQGRASQ